jgi:hypothetical protein
MAVPDRVVLMDMIVSLFDDRHACLLQKGTSPDVGAFRRPGGARTRGMGVA